MISQINIFRKGTLAIAGVLLVFGFSSLTPEDLESSPQVLQDSATTASTVTVGTKNWMINNLDVSTFRNGEAIVEAHSKTEWKKAGLNQQPAWCYYNFDAENAACGKFYNWYAVSSAKKLAPEGYHIPTSPELKELSAFLGNDIAGLKIKNSTGWPDGANGSNETGLTVNPCGMLTDDGLATSLGNEAFLWSTTGAGAFNAYSFVLHANMNGFYQMPFSKDAGLNVRCVKD